MLFAREGVLAEKTAILLPKIYPVFNPIFLTFIFYKKKELIIKYKNSVESKNLEI